MGSVMFVPQAWRVVKTQHTRDLSMTTYIMLFTVSVLWAVYGVGKSAVPLVIVNVIVGTLAMIILVIKLRQDVFR